MSGLDDLARPRPRVLRDVEGRADAERDRDRHRDDRDLERADDERPHAELRDLETGLPHRGGLVVAGPELREPHLRERHLLGMAPLVSSGAASFAMKIRDEGDREHGGGRQQAQAPLDEAVPAGRGGELEARADVRSRTARRGLSSLARYPQRPSRGSSQPTERDHRPMAPEWRDCDNGVTTRYRRFHPRKRFVKSCLLSHRLGNMPRAMMTPPNKEPDHMRTTTSCSFATASTSLGRRRARRWRRPRRPAAAQDRRNSSRRLTRPPRRAAHRRPLRRPRRCPCRLRARGGAGPRADGCRRRPPRRPRAARRLQQRHGVLALAR